MKFTGAQIKRHKINCGHTSDVYKPLKMTRILREEKLK